MMKRAYVIRTWLVCLFSICLLSPGPLCVAEETPPASGARAAAAPHAPPRTEPTPHIDLYNPSDWRGPVVVEVPVGQIAVPGLIDWHAARLMCKGVEVPYAIREGRAHWKARLVAPVAKPRAEDLLVFSLPVAPHAWARVDIVAGKPCHAPALSHQDDKLLVRYGDLKVTIDQATGMLLRIATADEDILEQPLSIRFRAVKGGSPAAKTGRSASHVELVSSSSTPAMTELNFELDTDRGLKASLTYRVHAAGLVETWFDERPWEGTSPWLAVRAAQILKIRGKRETLSYLINRAPYYGFADYEKVVKTPAFVHRRATGATAELGEEFANGRRWNRRLYIVGRDRLDRLKALIELADEGLIVRVEPRRMNWPTEAVTIQAGAQAKAAAGKLAKAMQAAGLQAKIANVLPTSDHAKPGTAALRVVDATEASGIVGDGFVVQQNAHGGLEVLAGTRFGLTQAAERLARGIIRTDGVVRVPLVAENPTVNLRAGGFGGGNFEVDFPYGNDAEWHDALSSMIASGMNVMADLGMWSNWKMPVSYKYMPQLRSKAPDAFDELTGTKFSAIDAHRKHAIRLLNYLNGAGVTVWEWLPIGCAPSTFYEQYPEAESPRKGRATWLGSGKIPCHSHPKYREYLTALLREKLETYAVGGFVMIRDDNGGICDCERCQAALKASRTKNAAWDQYLIIYDILRKLGFQGDIAVYPYHDSYRCELDPLLPDDLLIVGHGSANALLTRHFERVAPMGDTWLDNLYVPFRVPPTARMKRLLADRPGFWIGGAYRGTELPWLSIGAFGWDASATPNSIRYRWAADTFGEKNALHGVNVVDAYERLREIYNVSLLPENWFQLDAGTRRDVARDARVWITRLRERLRILEQDGAEHDAAWLAHVRLYGSFVEYHLRRLQLTEQMIALVAAPRDATRVFEPLDQHARMRLVEDYEAILAAAKLFCEQAASVGGSMMQHTQPLLPAFCERMGGYEPWKLDPILKVKQFAGSVRVMPVKLEAGKPFHLDLELQNTGVFPWIEGQGARIELHGDVGRWGLPATWRYTGKPMVFGDRRTITLTGMAPEAPGHGELSFEFVAPLRDRWVFARARVELSR